MSILQSLQTWDRLDGLEQLQMKKEAKCGGESQHGRRKQFKGNMGSRGDF